MTRLQFAVRAIVAAPLAGAICALGFFLVAFAIDAGNGGEDSDLHGLFFLIVIWLVAAAPIGMAAGVGLGVVPATVSIVAWPALDRRLGTSRAIEASVALIAVIGFLETLFVARAFDAPPLEAFGWALGTAIVCASTLRWLLRRGLRAAERRAARAVAPY